MAKPTARYVCQECGAVHRKWAGKCEECHAWNTIEEELAPTLAVPGGKASLANGAKLTFASLADHTEDYPRQTTHFNELDRVLGGGLVPGSVVLVGGDPGIGKSTLLLQLAARLALEGTGCAYISGEESIAQISLRAARLNLSKAPVRLLTATLIEDIITTLSQDKQIKMVVVDSIQTMMVNALSSAPGTVSQVRAAAHELIQLAKQHCITLVLVGHVTKEGQLAGPKVLEHMVDTVLYFEGERGHHFRILRSVKNRFGGINEIGVFEMSDKGLEEVPNPSALFLSDRNENTSGSVVFAGMEGTRPVLVEVQALVAPTFMASPRRAVVGWDTNRLAMVIAILATRYGLNLMDKEVYLNVAGGLRVNEPAADLAVAAALLSSALDVPMPKHSIIFGELGLSGEVRAVSHMEARLKEAEKLGFMQAVLPYAAKLPSSQLTLFNARHITDLTALIKKTQPA